MTPIESARKKLPKLSHLDDDTFAYVVQHSYYPQMSLQDVRGKLGLKDAPAPEAERTWGEAATDTGRGIMAGAAGLVEAAGTVGGLTGVADMDNSLTRAGREGREYWESGQSEQLKAKKQGLQESIAAQEGVAGKFLAAAGGVLTDPALLADAMASNAAMMVPGMAVGRGVQAAAAARAMGAAAKVGPVAPGMAAAIGQRAGTLGTRASIGTGAALQGSDVAGDVYKDVLKQTPEQLAQNPEFAARVVGYMDAGQPEQAAFEQARHDAALSAARLTFPAAAAISVGASMLPGASAIERGLVGGGARNTIAAGAEKGLIRRMATGALGEASQEAIEEGGGALAGNLVKREQADPNQWLGEGVGENAGMGFAAGGPMGAIGGALERPAQTEGANQLPGSPVVPPPPTGVLTKALGTMAWVMGATPAPLPPGFAPDPQLQKHRIERQKKAMQDAEAAQAAKQQAAAPEPLALGYSESPNWEVVDTPTLGYDGDKHTGTLIADEKGQVRPQFQAEVQRREEAERERIEREEHLGVSVPRGQKASMAAVHATDPLISYDGDKPTGRLIDDAGQLRPETRAEAQERGQRAEQDMALGLTPDVRAAQARRNGEMLPRQAEPPKAAPPASPWDSMDVEARKAVAKKVGLNGKPATIAASKALGALSEPLRARIEGVLYSAPRNKGAQAAFAPQPSRVQNRDRATPGSIQQMQSIVAAPDYGRLGVGRDFANGAPVVAGGEVPPSQMGKTDYATASDGRRIPVRYAVVEAGEVLSSNEADGTPNAGYAEAGPEQLRAIAGNGRIAGLRASYRKGTAAAYTQELSADEWHGIPPATIAKLKHPVLVRIMPADEVTDDIGDVSNTASGLQMSPVEQARNDAARVSLAGLEFGEDGEVTPKTVLRFVQAMPVSEQGGLIDRGGPHGKAWDRLNAAIFTAAYDNDELSRLQAQAKDPEARNIVAAMTQAAPSMAKLAGAGALDIRPLVAQAAEIAVNARRNGVNLARAAQQIDLAADPAVAEVLAIFEAHSRNARALAEALKRAAEFAHNEASKADADLFGAVQKATRQDVLNQLKDPSHERAKPQEVEHAPGRDPVGQDVQREADEPTGRADPEGAEADRTADAANQEGFKLERPSAEELAQKADEQRKADEASKQEQEQRENKARADAERDEFVLTGSDHAADVAAAHGQGGLFDATKPAEAASPPKKPRERVQQARAEKAAKPEQADRDEQDRLSSKAKEAGSDSAKPDPIDRYVHLRGVMVESQVMIAETGEVATMRVDAGKELEEMDKREQALQDLKKCFGGKA